LRCVDLPSLTVAPVTLSYRDEWAYTNTGFSGSSYRHATLVEGTASAAEWLQDADEGRFHVFVVNTVDDRVYHRVEIAVRI